MPKATSYIWLSDYLAYCALCAPTRRQHSMSASARCFREGFFYGFLLKVDVIWSSLKHRDVLTASLFGSGSQRGRRKNCAKSREKRILKKGKKFMKKEKNFFPSSYGNMCSPKKAFSSCKTANGKHAPSKRWVEPQKWWVTHPKRWVTPPKTMS